MNKEGKRLAEIIKKTHKKLRTEYSKDSQDVWNDHVENSEILEEYAKSMHTLATEHWTKSSCNESRITWVHNFVINYLSCGGQDPFIAKEMRKITFHNVPHEEAALKECVPNEDGKWNLLDVGSCYNPFAEFTQYNVTAIDIAPAIEAVKMCDFLKVQITKENDVATIQNLNENFPFSLKEEENNFKKIECTIKSIVKENYPLTDDKIKDKEVDEGREISENVEVKENSINNNSNTNTIQNTKNINNSLSSLIENQFHIIVFSFFLEYIPSPLERFNCCEKAYALLKNGGLLCIVTPDSKHQGANVHLYKLWKITLENLGFNRIKYEKLKHFHGMVFRKSGCKEICKLDAEKDLVEIKKKQVKLKFGKIDYDQIYTNIYIPQDFQQ